MKSKKKKKKTVSKCKKTFLFEKIDKNIKINSPFLRNSEVLYLCPPKAGEFLIWGLKKVVRLKHVLFTVSALEMREREAYRKQTGLNVPALPNKVSALGHDQFMQVSL